MVSYSCRICTAELSLEKGDSAQGVKSVVLQCSCANKEHDNNKTDWQMSSVCCFSFHCPITGWGRNKTCKHYSPLPCQTMGCVYFRTGWAETQIFQQFKQLPYMSFICVVICLEFSLKENISSHRSDVWEIQRDPLIAPRQMNRSLHWAPSYPASFKNPIIPVCSDRP